MPGARDAAGARAFSNHAIYRVRCDDPPAMTLGLHVHVTYPGAVCVCAWPTRAGGARRVSRDPMRARLLSHVRQCPATSRCNSPRESDAADRIPWVQGGGIRPLSSASCRERMASSRSSCSRSSRAAGELIRVLENGRREASRSEAAPSTCPSTVHVRKWVHPMVHPRDP